MAKANSNKRKATELEEDYGGEDLPKKLSSEIETLLSALDDRLEQFVDLTNKRFKMVEDQLDALTEQLNDCSATKLRLFNQSIEAGVTGSGSEQEDSSDDEDSVVDPSDTWMIRYQELREYKMLNGDCKVPFKYDENPKLGTWVYNQRKNYTNLKGGKKGPKITNERIIKLDSIGFHWGKKFPSPKSWDEWFEELQNFKQKLGHCNVPHNEANPMPLAKWLAYQRTEHKRFLKGKDSLLNLDQIQKLKEIGINWKGPKL